MAIGNNTTWGILRIRGETPADTLLLDEKDKRRSLQFTSHEAAYRYIVRTFGDSPERSEYWVIEIRG